MKELSSSLMESKLEKEKNNKLSEDITVIVDLLLKDFGQNIISIIL